MKRRLWATACLLTTSLFFTVQAQDTQPTEDPVVAEAVATLIAQTQQAQTQISMTQTIQAALESALTATAQAPTAAPGATTVVPTIDVEALEVANVTELELRAGPGNTGAFLAPDGEKFVHAAGNELCLYEGTQEVRCVDLEAQEMRALDSESFRWSPDSRYVVFHEDFFRRFNDPDIWVWDTTTETLSNLTEDNTDRISISAEVWDNVDVAPTWTAEGNLIFARYRRDANVEEVIPPDIYQIAPDGSNLTLLGSFEGEDRFSVYSTGMRGSQLLYVYYGPSNAPNNGVWLSNTDGSEAERVAQLDEDARSFIIGVTPSPDGRYLLILTPNITFVSGESPEGSVMRLVEVESGRVMLIDPTHYVSAAGWSPSGSALVYSVFDLENEENNGLYVTETPGKAGRMLLEGAYFSPTPGQTHALIWGANNTLLAAARNFDVTLIELEG